MTFGQEGVTVGRMLFPLELLAHTTLCIGAFELTLYRSMLIRTPEELTVIATKVAHGVIPGRVVGLEQLLKDWSWVNIEESN